MTQVEAAPGIDPAPAGETLSFVLPARNEERYIAETLESIRRFAPSTHRIEIVVVDNVSADRTADIARASGARVVTQQGTVAALRNAGVALTSGAVIVFLDADVLLTPAWQERIGSVLDHILQAPDTVTGSRCGISRQASWIERTWFEPLLAERANYINSGHLITSRSLFDRIGGFDVTRETGEDSDFSNRARAAGASIVNDPSLKVIHEGYPKTLGQFIRRERWHGRGNFQSWATVRGSRIAPMTITFLGAHAALLAGAVAGSAGLAVAGGALVALLCLVSAAAKYRSRLSSLPAATHLYYWYYAARSMALFDALRSHFSVTDTAVRRHR